MVSPKQQQQQQKQKQQHHPPTTTTTTYNTNTQVRWEQERSVPQIGLQ
jgi:hypothetical protein